jgi:hypothetical protein
MDSVADVLRSVRKKGVRLWSENGQLYYKAPKGALTQDEFDKLRVSKSQLVALLEIGAGGETSEPRLQPRPRLNRVPLAFSQLAYWHLYQLSERRAVRHIASATRLRGRLNFDALKESVAEIVRRHDALRTRIVVLDGVPMQEISESDDCELKLNDLTELSESFREAEVKRIIEQLILEPIDVAVGPLFGMRLLRLQDDDHVLIVVMGHMISDESSISILLRDLFTAYMQALKGRAFSLPAIPVQFADFAVWQRIVQTSWIERHLRYWTWLSESRWLKFPEDQRLQTESRPGWGTVRLQIGSDLKAELREWCRLRQTTLVMSVFTAYVGLVLRWCGVSEAMIRYVTDGRVSPKIENTIGFFASVLYARVALYEGDSFVDLINRVTEAYCQANEHADFSYMAAQVPRPDFTRSTAFNWVPQGSKIDLSDLDGTEYTMKCSPVRFAHPMARNLELDGEPSVLLFDADDEIVGDVYFPLNRFSMDTMERFGRNFLVFIRAMLRQPEEHVKNILLL